MKIEKYKDFIIERLKLNTDFNKTLSGERTNLSGINNKFYDKIKKMDNSLPYFYDTLKIFTELSSIKDVDGVIKFADNKQIRMIKDLDIPNDINLEDAKSSFIKKYCDDKINSLKSQGISIDTNSNLDNIIINLKDLISKKVERVLSISLDKIISDNNLNSNNIVYFTHVSLNQNLTIDDIKNQINPQSELRDKLPGTAFDKIKDKWGFYVSIYDEDPKTEYDAFHYISRATEMRNGKSNLGIDFDKLHKACIYQLTLKPDSLFIDCENLEFRMVNEISKDVYDSIIEWGFDGVYDKTPYEDSNSVLEISICNVDSIENIVKRNDLKLNIIKEILKSDTEKEHFEWLIKDMIKHVDIITKEVFDVICDYYGKDVILNKTKDILENLNDPFSGLGFKAEDVQKIIDLSR